MMYVYHENKAFFSDEYMANMKQYYCAYHRWKGYFSIY